MRAVATERRVCFELAFTAKLCKGRRIFRTGSCRGGCLCLRLTDVGGPAGDGVRDYLQRAHQTQLLPSFLSLRLHRLLAASAGDAAITDYGGLR